MMKVITSNNPLDEYDFERLHKLKEKVIKIRVYLKIVPDKEPNADGRWILAEIPQDFNYNYNYDYFKLVPIEGHHVVATRSSLDESMEDLTFPPPQIYVFEPSWLKLTPFKTIK